MSMSKDGEHKYDTNESRLFAHEISRWIIYTHKIRFNQEADNDLVVLEDRDNVLSIESNASAVLGLHIDYCSE